MLSKLGGTKLLRALVVVIVLLAVFVILALRGALGEGLAGIMMGGVTWMLTQFGVLNTRNNTAYLEAKREETRVLGGLPAADVLDRAGEREEATSPAPSLLRLTEQEIVWILGPEESYRTPEIAMILLGLQAEARQEIRFAAEEAAAEAVRAVLVELAGQTARAEAVERSAQTWRAAGILGLAAAAVGWMVALLT